MSTKSEIGVVTCLIDMSFSPEEAERAVNLLVSAVGRTEAKTGCQSCSVLLYAAEIGRVCYREVWNSESPFRKHVCSEEFRRVLAAMDMCREEPEVTIGTLSGHTGMAYLQSLSERPNEDLD